MSSTNNNGRLLEDRISVHTSRPISREGNYADVYYGTYEGKEVAVKVFNKKKSTNRMKLLTKGIMNPAKDEYDQNQAAHINLPEFAHMFQNNLGWGTYKRWPVLVSEVIKDSDGNISQSVKSVDRKVLPEFKDSFDKLVKACIDKKVPLYDFNPDNFLAQKQDNGYTLKLVDFQKTGGLSYIPLARKLRIIISNSLGQIIAEAFNRSELSQLFNTTLPLKQKVPIRYNPRGVVVDASYAPVQ